MSAQILDGRKLSQDLKVALKKEIEVLLKETSKTPSMVNIMIGENHSACAYANSQKRQAEDIGIKYELAIFPEDVTQDEIVKKIEELNKDKNVNGIMIHKPVPSQIDYNAAAKHLDTAKDLEGINANNIGRMILGETKIIPCTPASAMEHIKSTGIDLRGKEAVIVGHSEIVGKPLSLLLLDQYATVTICHIATSEAGKLEEHVSRADVLVVAVGRKSVIKGDWIKEGAIVIDVGINQDGDKIVGDVEFDTAKEKAAYITPVPGGVGPVTVVSLMKNCIVAFKIQMEG
ncbi:MAG: bifunctional 5,10-methylenetetrahydrofolate dehydrogenase/5,10-methenyltetrahydrofolate cyclohydrolase [Candidatus Zapsychrus exili]|nr:bifunctional 5,10-methylenetetrahydrofolate dehydrogenase/5,10-methenyltetrahydrofolate cyclohydrolase [Candidatus Zapsychrus exili]